MKKLISGKFYDSDTAEMIAVRSHGIPSDARYVDEGLYRTRKNAFFLHGRGRPFSAYGKPVENMWSGSEDIFALSDDEARDWLEAHADAKAYAVAFGEPEEA